MNTPLPSTIQNVVHGVAVVNRVEGMLRDYPDTQATRDALPLMENAYRQMQMNAQAEKVAKIIAANSSNT